MEWLQITISTTRECSELVAMLLYDAGSEGVLIKDDADIRELIEKKLNWDYVDESLLAANDNRALVSGFFPVGFDACGIHSALCELRERSIFPTGSLEVSQMGIDSEDWENEWRKYYAPIEIGKVVIVPAWQSAPDNGEIPVFIEPGMAFGTGNHETTSACVELMQRLDFSGKTVLDMGCGSGILGITAAKLGAKSVILSDIDRQAIEATETNVRLNKVEELCKTVCGDLDTGEIKADIVIANITADVLIRLKGLLGDALKLGGDMVISGIINARADEVKAAYEDGFTLREAVNRGEWNAMLLKKNGGKA